MSSSPYRFHAVTAADLALIRGWRLRPHVIQWWGPPGVEDPAETLADARIAMWIVEHEGRPFAYAQDYSPHDWDPHPFSYLPWGSRGIDQFIGEPDMIRLGHGSAFIRHHVDALFAGGALAVGTDPHPDNVRAIRACDKAGFKIASEPLDTRWGRAVLMECWQRPAKD